MQTISDNDKQLFEAIMSNKERHEIWIDEDFVTLIDNEKDIDDHSGYQCFDAYGNDLLVDILRHLGITVERI